MGGHRSEHPVRPDMMGDEFGGPVPVGPFRLIGSEAIGEAWSKP